MSIWGHKHSVPKTLFSTAVSHRKEAALAEHRAVGPSGVQLQPRANAPLGASQPLQFRRGAPGAVTSTVAMLPEGSDVSAGACTGVLF